MALWEKIQDVGSGGGIRTPDPDVNGVALCRLSYSGTEPHKTAQK